MKVRHWGKARNFVKGQTSKLSSRDLKALKEALEAWKKAVIMATWKGPADIQKMTFANVSYYRNKALIFNIGGNKYRLIAICRYELGTLYIDKVMTHEEYDKNEWKKRYDRPKA